MTRTLSVALGLALGGILVVSTSAQTPDITAGTWRIDLTKSKYDPPALAPKRVTATSTAVTNGSTVVVDNVDSTGKALHYEYTSNYDGRDVSVKNDPSRDTTAMRKIDNYTYEQTNKKGGKVTTISRWIYAKDGKSRTQTTTGTNPQGQKVSNTVLWIKQ